MNDFIVPSKGLSAKLSSHVIELLYYVSASLCFLHLHSNPQVPNTYNIYHDIATLLATQCSLVVYMNLLFMPVRMKDSHNLPLAALATVWE